MGGVYIVCDGFSTPCDGLPVELSACACCEFEVAQARSMQPIHAGYLASLMKGHQCKDEFPCPVCFFGTGYHALKAEIARLRKEILTLKEPFRSEQEKELAKKERDLPKVFYLMFVSKDFYTPESFIEESRKLGISKRVAANSLPKGFVVGKDWVFLAHGTVKFYPVVDGEVQADPRIATGIFHAFRPQRLEVLMWKGTDAQTIADYEEAGYTVVLLEKTKENIERHGNGHPPPLPYGFKRKPKGTRDRGVSKDRKKIGADFDKGELSGGD